MLKLFILGLPGSGKSSVARYTTSYLEDKNWKSIRFSDHIILQRMFHTDTEGKQFSPADHGGFDILDLNALDTALQKLAKAINQHLSSAKQEEIVLIEFARNDYQKAFQQFGQAFLLDAYFLYLDVDIGTCKRRILERIANPSTRDDFFVSEYIFTTYYDRDNGQDIALILEKDFGIEKQRVEVIDNSGSLLDSATKINQFVDLICGLETLRDS